MILAIRVTRFEFKNFEISFTYHLQSVGYHSHCFQSNPLHHSLAWAHFNRAPMQISMKANKANFISEKEKLQNWKTFRRSRLVDWRTQTGPDAEDAVGFIRNWSTWRICWMLSTEHWASLGEHTLQTIVLAVSTGESLWLMALILSRTLLSFAISGLVSFFPLLRALILQTLNLSSPRPASSSASLSSWSFSLSNPFGTLRSVYYTLDFSRSPEMLRNVSHLW